VVESARHFKAQRTGHGVSVGLVLRHRGFGTK
jgi:hypothetical protein